MPIPRADCKARIAEPSYRITTERSYVELHTEGTLCYVQQWAIRDVAGGRSLEKDEVSRTLHGALLKGCLLNESLWTGEDLLADLLTLA